LKSNVTLTAVIEEVMCLVKSLYRLRFKN